jgi:predicted metal-binding protein
MLSRLKRALRSLLRRTQVQRELDEELRYHSVRCLWPERSCSNSQETPTAISYIFTLN